jgi:hypothetical protein
MLFALPGYQFPYTVMNRYLYLRRGSVDRALMVLEGLTFSLIQAFQEQGNCFLGDIPRGRSRIRSPSQVAMSLERHVSLAKLDVRLWSTWSSNLLPPSWHKFLLFSIQLRPVARFAKIFEILNAQVQKKALKKHSGFDYDGRDPDLQVSHSEAIGDSAHCISV